MSRTVDIPGGTATVRDPEDLTERQRRTIRKVMLAAMGDALGEVDVAELSDDVKVRVTPSLGDAMFELRDAGIVAGLIAWSLDGPIPTLDTVQDLPASLYDALAAATAGLTEGMSVDTSPSPDPESPTLPSSDSGGLLRAEETPIPQPLISGVNTSTASSTT